MSRELTMPIDADAAAMESGGRTFSKLYYMLPKEDGKKAVNKLFFNLFRPSRFSKFSYLPEDLLTFYLRIPGHYVEEIDGESGFVKKIFVCCKKSFGEHLESVIRIENPFKGEEKGCDCPSCEESQRWWDKYNARREVIGLGKESAKGLSKEEYRKKANADPELQSYRDEAIKYSAKWRYLFSILDYAKLVGDKQLDEGEEQVQQQTYFGPKKIFELLHAKYQVGFKFFDLDKPLVAWVTRDNEKGAIRCDYLLELAADPAEFSEEEITYLEDETTVPDPSEFVEFLPYDELAERIGIGEEAPELRQVAPKEEEKPKEEKKVAPKKGGALEPQKEEGDPKEEEKLTEEKPKTARRGAAKVGVPSRGNGEDRKAASTPDDKGKPPPNQTTPPAGGVRRKSLKRW